MTVDPNFDIGPRKLRKVADFGVTYSPIPIPDADGIEDANVVCSDTIGPKKNEQYPVIDLDVPVRYVPSTTEGHGHLYIDHPIKWGAYKKLLHALKEAGLVEEGYVKACISHGYTIVRLPWIKKEPALEGAPL